MVGLKSLITAGSLAFLTACGTVNSGIIEVKNNGQIANYHASVVQTFASNGDCMQIRVSLENFGIYRRDFDVGKISFYDYNCDYTFDYAYNRKNYEQYNADYVVETAWNAFWRYGEH